jgi:hypothetical protein
MATHFDGCGFNILDERTGGGASLAFTLFAAACSGQDQIDDLLRMRDE